MVMYSDFDFAVCVGAMVVDNGRLAKVISITNGFATLARIDFDKVEIFESRAHGLVPLSDALYPRSTWIDHSQGDVIALLEEERRAQAEIAERKKRARKAKVSKRIKKRKSA